MACQGLFSNEILVLLRRLTPSLTEAELVDDASSLHSDACLAAAIFFFRVPAAPVRSYGKKSVNEMGVINQL